MSTINNGYAFTTKAQIKTRVTEDPTFALQCLVILYKRQTETEVATKSTISRNKRGFMSSHAVWGCKLAEKVLAGQTLDDAEMSRASEMVSHYSKQLAAALREEASPSA